MIKKILYFVTSTFLGMFGGQKEKGVRRFGIPGLALFASSFNFEWRHLAILLLIPTLIMGYGENSWLNQLTHSDVITRLAYAVLLSFPFIFWGIKRWLIISIALIISFQIHAGKLFTINGFDFLIEDSLRYGVLSLALISIVFKNPRR